VFLTRWDLSGYSCKSSGRVIRQASRASNGRVFRLGNAVAVKCFQADVGVRKLRCIFSSHLYSRGQVVRKFFINQ